MHSVIYSACSNVCPFFLFVFVLLFLIFSVCTAIVCVHGRQSYATLARIIGAYGCMGSDTSQCLEKEVKRRADCMTPYLGV